jgi:hypothetical protein
MGTIEHAAALARTEDLRRSAARARLAAEAADAAADAAPLKRTTARRRSG